MTTRPCRSLALALTLFGAMAAAPSPCVAHTPADPVLLMRFAFLVGTEGPSAAPASAGVLAPRDLQAYLQKWDFNADREEVRRVFALNHLTEVARQATELPANGGKTQGLYTLASGQYEIHMSVIPLDRDVRVEAELSKNGQVLSAPTVLVKLGDVAVISTAEAGGGKPTLFFVIEIERRSVESRP
ncbi:MAG: hypothetical protein ABI609_05645 [Acidobacteriota bacterium]